MLFNLARGEAEPLQFGPERLRARFVVTLLHCRRHGACGLPCLRLLHQIEAAKALLQTGIIEVPGRVQPRIQCLLIRRSRLKRELGDEGQGFNARHHGHTVLYASIADCIHLLKPDSSLLWLSYG